MAANQIDFKILPSDQFSVYSPQTRSDKVITYFTLLSKLRGDILSVGQEDDPNNIVSAFYINTGNVQTLHLVKADGSEVTASNSFAGTVTSVDMSVPTGFSISGNPITTSGTLAVGFASGYSLPTNAIQATWTTAYNRSLTSAAVTGTSTKTLTLNQQDGGTITASWSDIDTGLTSVGLTMPAAFSVANSPLTANGTLAVTAAGLSSQYIRGDGQLANFPTPGGGGSSVNYYLNGSVSQGTFGGVTYYELSKTPIAGAGTNFTRTSASGDGYVASFITDANDPDQINIPGGNWNLEFYFNSSSSGGSPAFYGELYKVSVSNVFTLIASGSVNPESITGGTTVDQYYTSIAVPQTALLSTDRLAIRVYVIVSGKNITLHTENSNFSEVITTFSTGLNSLNGLSDQVQYFAVGTSGTDFAISSSLDTHTFNLPTASAANRGALSSADWTTFNSKQGTITLTTTGTTGAATFISNTLNIPSYTDQFVGTVTSVNLTAGTGITVSGGPITTSGSITVNNSDRGSSQNIFKNFAVAGQSTIVADTNDDTLTIVAGSGVTLTTNDTTDTLTISASGSGGTVTSVGTSAPLTGGPITATGTIGITQSGVSTDGYLSSTDWNTFNNKQSTLLFSGPLVNTSGTVSIPVATTSVSGYLNNTDWTTFNSKQNAITLTTTGTTGAATLIGATLNIPNYADQFVGTVTSVNMSVPTGFAISGNPITTSGTLAVAFDTGYSLPTNASQTTWNTAYNDSITAFAYNTSTAVLTLTQQDAGTLTATVTLQPFTTSNLAEGTNLYYTDTRARLALSAGTGITYDNATGIITNSAPSSGGTVTSVAALTIGTTGTDLSSSVVNGTTTPVITLQVPTASAANRGALSSTDWTTFNSKQGAITLTTTGSSGAATFISNTLNIPDYGSALSAYLPLAGGTLTGALGGTSAIFSSSVTATDFIFGTNLFAARRYVSTIGSISNAGYTNVCNVTGNGLASAVRMTFQGTTGSVVVNTQADILVNHYQDIYIKSESGIYTILTIRIISDNNENYTVQATTDSPNAVTLNIEVFPLNSETVVFSASALSGSTLTHICYPGMAISATGGVSGNFRTSGDGTFDSLAGAGTRMVVASSTGLLSTQAITVGTVTSIDLTAGTGITVSGGPITTSGSITVTNNDRGSSQNIFKNIAVAGQSTIVADVNDDTLTVVAGSGVTITTNDTTDTITISATGSGGSVTSVGTSAPITGGTITTTGTIGITQSGAAADGYLSSTDWNTFNNKQNALTNPVTGTGTTNYVSKFTSSSAIGNSQIFDDGTNVGIGTASPLAKLHVAGTVATDSALADVSAYRIIKPNSGFRVTANSSETGAIKITYPVGFTNTMHRIKLNVYEYVTNESFTIYFGGYNYAPGSSWYNPFAYILGNPSKDQNYTVRFGYNGTSMVVYIGELATGWTYPQIFIEEVELGYGGMSNTWRDGAWTISFEASAFQNVTETVSNTQATNLARSGSNAYYGFGNVGIGTSNPTAPLDTLGVRIGRDFSIANRATVRLDANGDAPADVLFGRTVAANESGWNGVYWSISSRNSGAGAAEGNKFTIWRGSAHSAPYNSENQFITITPDLNVGIGTTAPSAKLHVSGGDGIINNAFIGEVPTYTSANAQFSHTSRAAAGEYSFLSANDGETFINSKTGTNIRFRVNNNDKVIIDSAGNVGIGNTGPSQILHVTGNIRVTGAYYDSGNSSGTSGQILSSTATGTSWIATTGGTVTSVGLTGGTGITISGGPITTSGSITVTNSAPDQTVVLTGGTGITTSGTYPSFTVTNSAPDQTVALTAGTGISISGTYPSFTITNTSAGGGTITGSGTTNYVPKWTSASAIGDSAIYDNAGNIGIGTATPGSLLQVGNAGAAPTGLATLTLTGANTAPQIATKPGLYHRHAVGLGVFSDYAMSFQVNGSSALSDAMFITNDSKVGIGTTSPASILHVSSTGANAYSSTITKGSNLKGIINTLSNNGDDMVGIYFATGVDTSGNHWSGITGSRSLSSTNWGTQLNFYTHDENLSNINDATQKMVIKGSGNVGIGTTAPGALLDVGGGDGTPNGTQFTSVVKGTSTRTMYFDGGGSSGASVWWGDGNTPQFAIDSVSGGGAAMWVHASSAWYRIVDVAANGNVGINQTSPQQKLDVFGNISLGSWTKPGSTYVGLRRADDGSFGGGGDSGLVIESYNHAAPYNGDYSQRVHLRTHLYNGGSNNVLTAYGTNVGIGTTAPGAKLHVIGNVGGGSGYNGGFYADNGSGSAIDANWGFDFSKGASDDYSTRVKFYPAASSARKLGFYDARNSAWLGYFDGNANSNPNFIFSSGGNVLIGTTTDNGYKLRVNGKGYFDNNVVITPTSESWAEGLSFVMPTTTTWGGLRWRRERVGNDGNWYIGFTALDSTDDLVFGANNGGTQVNNIIRLTKAGNVGINTTSPSYKLDVTGDARINTGALGVNIAPSATDGRIDASNDIVAFSSSDLRLKENIKPIENALEKVKSLTGVEFDWKPELKHAHGYEGHDTGVIAQEVQEVMPTAIRTNDTGYLAVRYEKLIGLLIEGMKEQQLQIDELKSKLK